MNDEKAMDGFVRNWLDVEVSNLMPPTDLHGRAMGLVRHKRQRGRIVTALLGSRAGRGQSVRARDGWAFAIGAALVIVIAIGALAVGYRAYVDRPAATPLIPAATPTSSPSPSPANAAPSFEATTGRVAYVVPRAVTCPPGRPPLLCQPISTSWLAHADGSDAQPLMGVPLGWSSDGSTLLLRDDTDLIVADATGSEMERIVISTRCKEPTTCSDQQASLCSDPCTDATDFALSPDGTRVAFTRSYPNNELASVVAVLDLATQDVNELQATRVTNGSERCWEHPSCEGTDAAPRWSPDGTQIAFARQGISPEPTDIWTGDHVLLVNADGSNLRRATPVGTNGFDPEWSADGQRLVFTGVTFVVNAARTSVDAIEADIFAMGTNGNGLVRLTHDGISSHPEWTADGRVVFTRQVGPGDSNGLADWSMDPDGANQSLTGGTLAALTAAGCTTCIYPLSADFPQFIEPAYWQPGPEKPKSTP